MSLLQFTNDMHNSRLSQSAKNTSFQNFYNYFTSLKNIVLPTLTYTDNQLAQHIFKTSWPEDQAEMIFKKHLFAAFKTLERFDAILDATNIMQYEKLLTMLGYDLFTMVAWTEAEYKKTPVTYDMGSRPDQHAREIFDASNILFTNTAYHPVYVREIAPVTVFMLRQTIEVYGKKTLGISSITDANGNYTRSVPTQVAWDFIKMETKKRKSRITLPAHIDTIRKVEAWTNYYVHTGFLQEIYLIENAIHLIRPLVYPRNSTEKDFEGKIRFDGTAKIKQYNSVKTDFEAYVNQRRNINWFLRILITILQFLRLKKRQTRAIVNWMNVKTVDAVIVSL